MATIITPEDIPESVASKLDQEDLQLLLDGLNARASRLAPCLAENPTPDQLAEAKVVLVGVTQRWVNAGAGAFQSQTAGPFSVAVDTRERGGYTLRPTEIDELQAICSTGDSGPKAFSVETAPLAGSTHLPWCSLAWGAWCSCGADIAGFPIYERHNSRG